MDGGEARFKQRLPEDPFYDDQPLNELNNDINAALKAIKPNVPTVKISKSSARDNRDLREVILEQDKKDEKFKIAKEKNKEKYQVKNNFTPAKKTTKFAKKK